MPVRFAGFEASTLALQNQGWELSINERRDYDFSLQLALHHPQARLYGYSNPVRLNYGATMGRPHELMKYFETIGFDLICLSPSIQFHVVPIIGMPSFNPIDARPSLEGIESKKINIHEMNIFQPINTNAEIIIDKSTVPELLEIIQKKQMPSQAEIRERLRKERQRVESREGLRFDAPFGYESRKDIKAQLVCVG